MKAVAVLNLADILSHLDRFILVLVMFVSSRPNTV